MSFDVFLQGFDENRPDRLAEVHAVLGAVLSADGGNVVTADGGAEVYGLDDGPVDGLMFTHIVGEQVWDLMLDVAVACGWVVLPLEGPVCLVSDDQAGQVPLELDLPRVVVRTGAELRAAVLS